MSMSTVLLLITTYVGGKRTILRRFDSEGEKLCGVVYELLCMVLLSFNNPQ